MGDDLDIFFHETAGYPENPAARPPTVGYQTRAAGGESGTVPPYPHVIVCLYEGVDVDFTYDAGGKRRG